MFAHRLTEALPATGGPLRSRWPTSIHCPRKNLMDRRTSAVALLAAVTLAACSPDLVAPSMAPSSPSFAKAAGQSSRHLVLDNAGEGAVSFAARIAALGGSVDSYHAGSGFAVVSGLTSAATSSLAASGVSVQPDVRVAAGLPEKTAEADASEVATEISSQANPTTASRYVWQWNMRLVNAPAAWAAGKLGSSTVTVALLDTGLDYDAPDLNGLVDLSRSKSFMDTFVGVLDDTTTKNVDEYTPIIPADDVIAAALGRHPVVDLHGHGTNVATQVSSKAAALAGVTSKTTLIGVKVLGANGYGNLSDILNGVLWAADHGADVANMSLGGGFGKSGNGYYVGLINSVFNYAKDQGMLIVVAAGNSGINIQFNGNTFSTYCDAPHVICVSAVGPSLATSTNLDEPSFFTNYGKNSVDIAAPGGNAFFNAKGEIVPSAWPWGTDIASWFWSVCAKQRPIIQKAADGINGSIFLTACAAGHRLTGNIGTSQASPHVAGLAALLVAEGVTDPATIKQRIQKSSDPLASSAYGRGRINVKKALGL